ncbi:hypothetical protein B0T26DRAFT_755569 [Lasiosphaeria miniovina]|uniref:MEI5 protein n=1 Tax=Lasiosphaeria miniovina TaxID=1954250 RepID=A0AA39ZYN5_9PEZI|nr:uncharacterized protein B0T26DRAFT_755569 [Lasiosphaeria miniovina]KAK0706028.1 hypothetical protein B0T26DRAFT_755569 [Lasiosphaeria miniovina]
MSSSNNHAENVAALLNNVLANPSVKHLSDILAENGSLQKNIERLKDANDVNQDRNAELRAKLNSLRDQYSDKKAELEDHLKKKLALDREVAEARKKLKSATEELDAKKRELEGLEGFAIKLIPLSPEDIASWLNNLFLKARKVAEAYFGVDFSSTILEDHSIWSWIKDHETVRRAILPLPLSNTPPAKQMRMAAFLAILSVELSEKLFQPTYLLGEDGRPLSDLLSGLAEKDPRREAYLRSVLLATAPDDHRLTAQKYVQSVVNTVMSCFKDVLSSAEQRDKLSDALTDLCSQASELWQHMQALDKKIEPDVADPDPNDPDWNPVVFPSLSPPPKNQAGNRNGSGPGSGGGDNGPINKKTAAQAKLQVDTSADLMISGIIVVWPRFRVVDSPDIDEHDALAPGYALAQSTVLAAKDEEKALLSSGRLSGRQKHNSRKSRGMSMTVTNGAEGSSDSRSFLSSKAGGGQKGA